ncbi:hypothetical protein GYMLUDRAFT_565281 [Collybiopsis luxurians FD-317 M1]|uniref:Velvet domain-containing protein n=1 Tax=Collybiopsis luxurians FD-317 M1 TaxID=944289 RepID=A0A0D0CR23_9AGAR|nr:hypothetical protein GYMLUDRAFT_565281 [Collybiopsis luxurians FD-317 M1]
MMIHSIAQRFPLSADEQAVDIPVGVCSPFTDIAEMCKSHLATSPIERTEFTYGGPRRNHKPRRASLSLGSHWSSQDDDHASYSYRDSDTECSSPVLSRFPTRKLPPPLKIRRYSGSSSGQSSPQSAYSPSSSFYSSRGSPRSSRSSPLSSHGSFSNFSPLYSQRSSLPRIQVSSLLSDPRILSYHLRVVQEPLKAAEFSNSPLSRLPVTPPVLVRLDIHDASGNPVLPEAELPFLIAHLSLYNENGLERVDIGSYPGAPPMLYGNLVSSVEQLEDLQGNRGLFFLFPDFSIQTRGRYQLGITLLRISG